MWFMIRILCTSVVIWYLNEIMAVSQVSTDSGNGLAPIRQNSHYMNKPVKIQVGSMTLYCNTQGNNELSNRIDQMCMTQKGLT